MSQTSGAAAGSPVSARLPSTGRAVLLLALFVIIGVVILQAIDDTSATLTSSSTDEVRTQAAAPLDDGPADAIVPAPTPAPVAITRPPSEVKVLVTNGTTVNGAASRVAGRLQPVGYQLLRPNNTTAPALQSAVQFAPGFQAEAQAVATSLGIPVAAVQALPIPAPVTDLQGSNVLVIVGSDLSGQAANPAPAAAAGNGAEAGASAPAASGAGGSAITPQQPAGVGNPATDGPLTRNSPAAR